jgi:GT2 family glycosyltransferase
VSRSSSSPLLAQSPRPASGGPTVSGIVVAHESGRFLHECLGSLAGQPGLLETIIVDNGSEDGSVAAATEQFPAIIVVVPGDNAGFAKGANAGARAARGQLLLFLDADARLAPGSVAMLARAFERDDVGVAAPRVHHGGSGIAEYGNTIDPLGYPVGLSRPAPPLYVPTCAAMTRAGLFHELGGFDERFFAFAEDVDYCWRVLLAGRDVQVVPDAFAWHHGGGSVPGGYVKGGALSTTRFRVVLRERNTLAMLLKCYSLPSLAVVLPLYVLQAAATAAALALRGQRRTALEILGGLAWNARELPRTLELRRPIQASRALAERAVLTRMHRGLQKLSLLRTYGLPQVEEAGPPMPPDADGGISEHRASSLPPSASGRSGSAGRPGG